MSERPILFSGEMVRAILRGQKTVTRRVVRSQLGNRGEAVSDAHGVKYWRRGEEDPIRWCGCDGLGSLGWVRCPYGTPGDLLWLRESWHDRTDRPASMHDPSLVCYAADGEPAEPSRWRKRPSIHMPRWASRLTLRVTDVRVERVQEISEADAKAEGVRYEWDEVIGHQWYPEPPGQVCSGNAREAFQWLWDSINGKRPGCAWADSPWVWVVSFERVEGVHADS
jgi:hypothetical protein